MPGSWPKEPRPQCSVCRLLSIHLYDPAQKELYGGPQRRSLPKAMVLAISAAPQVHMTRAGERQDLLHPVLSLQSGPTQHTVSQPELCLCLFLICSHLPLAPCSPAGHTRTRPHPSTTGHFFFPHWFFFSPFVSFSHVCMWYMCGHIYVGV